MLGDSNVKYDMKRLVKCLLPRLQLLDSDLLSLDPNLLSLDVDPLSLDPFLLDSVGSVFVSSDRSSSDYPGLL